MTVTPDNAQHIGARETQQDAFGFSDLEQIDVTRTVGALSVVADGMGGMEQGQEMSRLACTTMIDAYTRGVSGDSIPQALSRALRAANEAVLARARQLSVSGKTGTTLVAAVIHNGSLYWTSVGDSRISLYRDGHLTQLTADHVYARHLDRQVAAGTIGEAEAAAHPERHAITSFLGLETLEEIDRTIKPFPLQPGDRVLLCTDGLHGTLTADEIGHVLKTCPTGATQTLIDAVIAKGREDQDNVTATLLDYLSEAARAPTQGRGNRLGSKKMLVALLLVVLVAVVGLHALGAIATARQWLTQRFGPADQEAASEQTEGTEDATEERLFLPDDDDEQAQREPADIDPDTAQEPEADEDADAPLPADSLPADPDPQRSDEGEDGDADTPAPSEPVTRESAVSLFTAIGRAGGFLP